MMRNPRVAAVLTCLALMAPWKVAAQEEVPSLRWLVGKQVDFAEPQIEQRGYALKRIARISDTTSVGYWVQPRTGRCVAIENRDARIAAIAYALDAECAAQPQPAPAPLIDDGEDNFDTVCGYESANRVERFRCHLRNEGCNSGGPCRTHLTLPDRTVTLTWQRKGESDIETTQDGAVRSGKADASERDGQTRISYEGRIFFVYRLESRAQRELAALRE